MRSRKEKLPSPVIQTYKLSQSLQSLRESLARLKPSGFEEMGTGMRENDSRNSTSGAHVSPQRTGRSRFRRLSSNREGVLKEEAFHTILTLERRRAERSRNPFALMLINAQAGHKNGSGATFIERLTSVVSAATRETDIIGWYEEGAILAVIFTELNPDQIGAITEILQAKIMSALRVNLDNKFASNLSVSVQVVPEKSGQEGFVRVADNKPYPEFRRSVSKKRASMMVMRAIDIVGSSI
jgi:GGDEF domain-containing protein